MTNKEEDQKAAEEAGRQPDDPAPAETGAEAETEAESDESEDD